MRKPIRWKAEIFKYLKLSSKSTTKLREMSGEVNIDESFSKKNSKEPDSGGKFVDPCHSDVYARAITHCVYVCDRMHRLKHVIFRLENFDPSFHRCLHPHHTAPRQLTREVHSALHDLYLHSHLAPMHFLTLSLRGLAETISI